MGRMPTEGSLPENIEVWASLQPVFHCLRLLHALQVRRNSGWLNERLVQRRASYTVGV